MVTIQHDKRTFELGKENFEASVAEMKDVLRGDVPVMVEEQKRIGAMRRLNPSVTQTLFFSNGRLNKDGFGVRRGKRQPIYGVSHGSDFEHYMTVPAVRSRNRPANIVLPWSSTTWAYNEGTFSPAGGVSWPEFNSGGTTKILIGDVVSEKYPQALDGIRFAERAHFVDVPSFYTNIGYLVRDQIEGNRKERDSEQNRREHQANKYARLRCVTNLVEQAATEMGLEFHERFSINQIGSYGERTLESLQKKYPVSESTYLLYKLMHPSRTYGFLDADLGAMNGVLAVPTHEFSEVFDLAFSNDFMKKFYPVGLSD